jgi:hypothetical protein
MSAKLIADKGRNILYLCINKPSSLSEEEEQKSTYNQLLPLAHAVHIALVAAGMALEKTGGNVAILALLDRIQVVLIRVWLGRGGLDRS